MTAEQPVHWITGAGGGIGGEVARHLAQQPCALVLTDRDGSGVEATAADIRKNGVKVLALTIDVRVPREVAAAADEILTEFGHLDSLVNCAGLSVRGPSESVAENDWDLVLDTNLKGTFLCCQAAAGTMIRQRRGGIVNIGSTAGAAGFPMRAAYGASKAGVILLTQVLATEWARHGIRVNCVSPAHTRTALLEDAIARGFVDRESLLRRIPMGRLGEPRDVAEAVAFLLSEHAQFITGTNLYVDGGWTALGIF